MVVGGIRLWILAPLKAKVAGDAALLVKGKRRILKVLHGVAITLKDVHIQGL